MIAGYLVIALVALQRVSEALYGSRNACALLRRGGTEAGRGHYPLMVLLHTAWLVAMVAGIDASTRLHAAPLVVFGVVQVFRVWVILALGPYWTTRVITVEGEPLVRRGPYRFVRHPNYLVVVAEVALLPLALGQVKTAIVFSIANLCLIAWRIRVENAVLASRATLRAC